MRWFSTGALKATAQWAAALVVAGFFLAGAAFMAGLFGWSTIPPGLPRLVEAPRTLLPSIVLGVLGILAARVILGRRPWSLWLFLGALPALFYGAEAIGLLP